MTATEIILTVFLAIACIIGGVLLYRLEHVTALNIDLRRENDALRKQIEDIKSLVEQEFNRLKAKRQ
ncbi:MAG: hypothetical protein IKP11_04695 [Paludibacteraceae bacterium]|nr:hypothetical protein [Paludibacteraceae bacterium]